MEQVQKPINILESYNSSVTLCISLYIYTLFAYVKLFFTREILLDFLEERFFHDLSRTYEELPKFCLQIDYFQQRV